MAKYREAIRTRSFTNGHRIQKTNDTTKSRSRGIAKNRRIHRPITTDEVLPLIIATNPNLVLNDESMAAVAQARATNSLSSNEDLIPTLLASNPTIAIKYKAMEFLDPHHRPFYQFQNRFRKWRAAAKELNPLYGSKDKDATETQGTPDSGRHISEEGQSENVASREDTAGPEQRNPSTNAASQEDTARPEQRNPQGRMILMVPTINKGKTIQAVSTAPNAIVLKIPMLGPRILKLNAEGQMIKRGRGAWVPSLLRRHRRNRRSYSPSEAADIVEQSKDATASHIELSYQDKDFTMQNKYEEDYEAV